MALVDDFARQFTPNTALGRTGFWREAVSEGSISRTKTGRASEEMKSPGGTVFWVHPGETPNLKAQGWSQLSTGVEPRAPGPVPGRRDWPPNEPMSKEGLTDRLLNVR